MKAIIQNSLKAGFVSLVLPTIALAAKPLPKTDLVTCEINKNEIVEWFNVRDKEAKAAFASAQNPLTLKLQQVDLAGQPGIADYFKVSVRGVDQDGKNVKVVQRDLEQIAVNYGENTISVGYAPYDVSRTDAQPFSLLIEGKKATGPAKGYMSFVPLQAMAQEPMKVLTLKCVVKAQPEEPVKISRKDVAEMEAQAQFELIYNLQRIGHTGKAADLDGGTSRRRRDTLADVGLSKAAFDKARAEISKILSARALTALPKWRDADKVKVTVVNGDRCGELEVSYVIPVYDSLTARAARRHGGESLKKEAIGYVIPRAHCKGPARIIETTNDKGEVSKSEDNWHVGDIVITSEGLIEGFSFKASTYRLY